MTLKMSDFLRVYDVFAMVNIREAVLGMHMYLHVFVYASINYTQRARSTTV